jgi:ATP-dependent DNA helicase RecG
LQSGSGVFGWKQARCSLVFFASRSTVRVPKILPLTKDQSRKSNKVSGGEVTGEVAGEVIKLLKVFSGEMKRKELQQKLGLKHEDHFRDAYLIPALDSGYVEMTQPDSPRSPTQKYRLTELGRQILAHKKADS